VPKLTAAAVQATSSDRIVGGLALAKDVTERRRRRDRRDRLRALLAGLVRFDQTLKDRGQLPQLFGSEEADG
jgi:hypothetical protein